MSLALLQYGLISYAAIVTATVFSSPLSVFSLHPLMMSWTLATAAQGLVSFGTSKVQHAKGRQSHRNWVSLAQAFAYIGIAAITIAHKWTLKMNSNHGKLGIIVAGLILVQSVVGMTVDESRSKKMIQLHRFLGSLIFVGLAGVSWIHIGMDKGYMEKASVFVPIPFTHLLAQIGLGMIGVFSIVNITLNRLR
ncbi:hypothetical protein EDD86DRAFT_204667 [Gorgonomyces haynaldii]|nr:hypothetical protein EDD86DRAFT_204667 [Gorgonomyces haynaldii]